MATTGKPSSPPPTPPLKDITRGTPSPEPAEKVERPARAPSPDSCPICLDEFNDATDRAYSDNCFHIFCFECLQEWSNNKRECPLCKKPFKAIIHKFKDNGSHEVHKLPPQPTAQRPIHFNPTISFEWVTQMRQEFLLRHRHRQRNNASRHSALPAANPMRPHTAERRRALYEHEMYCEGAQLPGGASRYRRTTPEFYRSNPAVVHRLIPWLNRELVAVLPHRDNVDCVLEQIIDLIKRHDIRSPAFRNAIRPFTLQYTDHFVHEFHMFAMSPVDMVTFDRHARYPRMPGYRRLRAHATLNRASPTQNTSSPAGRDSAAGGAAASSTTLSTADREEHRRSWHRLRLRDADRLQSRMQEARTGAGSSARSENPTTYRHHRWLDTDSSDSDLHPGFSVGRVRLSSSQRVATNRLERALRDIEARASSSLTRSSIYGLSRTLPTERSELNRDRARSRSPHRPFFPGLSIAELERTGEIDSPSSALAGSSRTTNTTTVPPRPSIYDSLIGLSSTSLDIPPEHLEHGSLLSRSTNAVDGASAVLERARRFLDDVGEQACTSSAAVDHQCYTAPSTSTRTDHPLSISTEHGSRDPLGLRQLYAADDNLLPLLRGRLSSSSSSSSVSPISVGATRVPSPALSSHSSDVVLVSEEKPNRARTPIVISSEDEEEFKARNREIPGSKRLSDSDDDSCDERLGRKDSVKAKKRPRAAENKSLRSPQLSQSSDECSNMPSTSHQSTSAHRKQSRSSDSDCVVTFQATKPKFSRAATANEEEREGGSKKKRKSKKSRHEERKNKKERKLKKRKRGKESKHHKHVLADVKLSDPCRAILSDYHKHKSAQSSSQASTGVSDPVVTPSSQSTGTPSSSSTSQSTAESGANSQQYNEEFSSPETNISKSVNKRQLVISAVRSLSPVLDVTSVSEPEGEVPNARKDWFIDYSKNGYVHRDGEHSKHHSGKHKNGRYFNKDGDRAKLYKKHDKGHKN